MRLCVYGLGAQCWRCTDTQGQWFPAGSVTQSTGNTTSRVCHFQTIKDQNYIYVCVVVFLKKKKKKKRTEREEAARREKKNPCWCLLPCCFVKCLQLAVGKAGWVERHGRWLHLPLVATGRGELQWNCCLLTELQRHHSGYSLRFKSTVYH